MGIISLSIPQSGQPNSTEDPKVATDLTTIQTAINGNLDDTNLFAPNNGVRRLLLQTTGGLASATANTYFFSVGSGVVLGASASAPPDLWYGDVGLSSQPQDFQVANKVAYARVRATIVTNATTFGATYGVGLYQLTSVVGGSGVWSVNGSVVAGSTINFTAPATDSQIGGESAQFTLPSANSSYFLGAFVNAPAGAGSALGMTLQLYGYNA